MENAKLLAARAALEYLPESGVIGLGSGSTSRLFVEEVGNLVRGGRKLYGVPTSESIRQLAEKCGIPLLLDEGPWPVDVCVDGADEVSAELDLIKGGGACQTREKIVNAAARTNVIIVDESKLSTKLGARWAVPIEVMSFGHQSTGRHLERFGEVTLYRKDGRPWLTDAGNYSYTVRVGAIDDPARLDRELHAIPGVVETGLFVGRADVVLVASESGIRKLVRR
jgi:ribose 5-phosphate isomerase A